MPNSLKIEPILRSLTFLNLQTLVMAVNSLMSGQEMFLRATVRARAVAGISPSNEIVAVEHLVLTPIDPNELAIERNARSLCVACSVSDDSNL